jgi:hypothetical protein
MNTNSLKKVNEVEKNITGGIESSTLDDSSTRFYPEIAKWFNDYDCAVSLRFDDNHKTHVQFVIPLLNKYNFKATFMINPGRYYNKYKDFWESEIPKMGHRWGNHTWHHKGAQNLEEAEFEIGEVSKLIWKLYPNESKLNVFASGGGELWGGKRWHKTSPEFWDISKKFHLIDVYDGEHNCFELNSEIRQSEIEKKIETAIRKKKHQAFSFHKVGNKSLTDYLRKIVKNFNYTFSEDEFIKLIQLLDTKKSQIWIAPLVQIYKYEEEYKNSELIILNKDERKLIMKLKIDSDPNLYDQELTLLLPRMNKMYPKKVLQNANLVLVEKSKNEVFYCNIMPVNSELQVVYEQ